MIQPALLGGLFIGVLSALPVVSVGNCCCAWVIGGGVIAAYLDAQQSNVSLPLRRGALDGALAGVVGAIVWLVVYSAIAAVLAPVQDQLLEELMRRTQAMPPDLREVVERATARSTSSAVQL